MSLLTRSEIDDLCRRTLARDRACVLSGDDGKCSQVLDPHHIIKQQQIAKLVPAGEVTDALMDVRGAVTLCRLHHSRVHGGMARLSPELLASVGFYIEGQEELEGFSTFTLEYELTATWEGILAKQLPTHRRLAI